MTLNSRPNPYLSLYPSRAGVYCPGSDAIVETGNDVSPICGIDEAEDGVGVCCSSWIQPEVAVQVEFEAGVEQRRWPGHTAATGAEGGAGRNDTKKIQEQTQ